jgi:hypothetical protein
VLEVVGRLGTGQHGDGIDTTVQTSSLLHTHCRAGDLEVTVAESDVVQAFNDSIDNFIVSILAESDTLYLVNDRTGVA